MCRLFQLCCDTRDLPRRQPFMLFKKLAQHIRIDVCIVLILEIAPISESEFRAHQRNHPVLYSAFIFNGHIPLLYAFVNLSTTRSPISWQRRYNSAFVGSRVIAGQSEMKSIRPSAQNFSYCRLGCHRSPNPSGERTIHRPPEVPITCPHAFSHGLMKVEIPAPPGPIRSARAIASCHSSPPSTHLREQRNGSTTGSSKSAALP